jgi:hypothetical protein
MADYRPGQRRRGQNDAAQTCVRVDKAVSRSDCEMQLPLGRTAQQYVAGSNWRAVHIAEAATIHNGSNSFQKMAPQRIIARNRNRISAQRVRHHTDTIEARRRVSSMQSEANANQIERAPRNVRVLLNWHRGIVSKGHCPADKVRREN